MKEKFAKQIIRNDSLVQGPNDIISGYARGYYTVIQLASAGNQQHIFLRFCAKEGSFPPSTPMQQFLTELKASNKLVQQAIYSNYEVEITMTSPVMIKKVPGAVSAILDQVWGYLAKNSYVTCCGGCGSTECSPSLYKIQGAAKMLCDECGTQSEQLVNEAQAQEKSKPVNMVAGIVGAMIGVLIGVVLWVLIYQMGYIAGIAGFVMMICAIKGFELLGGRLNIPGMIISIVMVLLAVYFAHNIAIAFSIMQEMDKASFGDAYKYIPYLMDYGEFSSAYYHDLIMGYGLTIVAIIPSISGYIKSRKQQFEVKKL